VAAKVYYDFLCVDLILLYVALIELLGMRMSSFIVYEDFLLFLLSL
jgi:hypothetical protein